MQKPNLLTGNALINKWKIKLSLTHWAVRLWIDETLPLEVRGRIYWEGQLKDATIVLNNRYDWSKYPVEQTVIHELLHLTLAETGDPSPEYIEKHIAVLSDLLFQAYGDRSV